MLLLIGSEANFKIAVALQNKNMLAKVKTMPILQTRMANLKRSLLDSIIIFFQITMYNIHLWKSLVSEDKTTRTTTEKKAIFTDLDDNTEYQFQVRANTRKGPGPWSSKVSFRTDRNIIRAPPRVNVSFLRVSI